MENNLFNDDLEFHYVIACRGGKWYHAVDVEQAVMSDGTVFDYKHYEWLVANNELETIDLNLFSVLQSALRQMNGEPNA